MQPRTAEIAGEILNLEHLAHCHGLNEDQARRWSELIRALMKCLEVDDERRKHLRLPAAVGVEIRVGTVKVACGLNNLSHVGIAAKGVLGELTVGDQVQLESIQRDGRSRPLGVDFRVVWKRDGESPDQVACGLEASSLGVTPRRIFFDTAYYPLYLRYLTKLTKR